jgi:hypothetical protein
MVKQEANTYIHTHMQRGLSLSQTVKEGEDDATSPNCGGTPSIDRCCVSVVAGDAIIDSCQISSMRGYGVMVWGQAQPTLTGSCVCCLCACVYACVHSLHASYIRRHLWVVCMHKLYMCSHAHTYMHTCTLRCMQNPYFNAVISISTHT